MTKETSVKDAIDKGLAFVHCSARYPTDEELVAIRDALVFANNTLLNPQPIPMRIHCPECGELHIDEGEFATKIHHTHACQHCGAVFRPAVVPTVGVRFLPGFKNG